MAAVRATAARHFTIALLALLLSLLSASHAAPPRHTDRASAHLPPLMLWAWERPTDLRGLAPGIGVAFLAQTIRVSDRESSVLPRRQPLRVDPATPLVAVTRIEAPAATLDGAQLRHLASAIARTAFLPRVAGVQIDFDAAESQRDFYRQLIRRVRAELPAAASLSITALASWCVGDAWLHDLPIDEAVPMLFRMGPVEEPLRRLALSRTSARAECGDAVGVSLDEPLPVNAAGRRVYVFNHRPWSADAVLRARQQGTP